MWRTDGRSFLGPRGMAEQPPGEESCGGRCGRTIAAQPVSDQTSPFEEVVAAANQAAGQATPLTAKRLLPIAMSMSSNVAMITFSTKDRRSHGRYPRLYCGRLSSV